MSARFPILPLTRAHSLSGDVLGPTTTAAANWLTASQIKVAKRREGRRREGDELWASFAQCSYYYYYPILTAISAGAGAVDTAETEREKEDRE